jgi:ADP-dependent NAD(P)H-hydrate dehydratase / NAD(P)H-hydrate epimerase
MITPSISLFQTQQIRDCETIAIRDLNIKETELMAFAGRAALKALKSLFPRAKKIVIYCGSGNNAGDGYVLALLAQQAGYSVIINQYKCPDKLPFAANIAAKAAIAANIPCRQYEDALIDSDVDLIVDALLGTGLHSKVREPFFSAINQINTSKLPVLSLDIPSGLDANTGRVMGIGVRAAATITFIGKKVGMMTLNGPDYCGEIICDDLNLGDCLATIFPAARILAPRVSPTLLPKRKKNCHKNDFGHVLVIGSSDGMPGAVRLAAMAALRVGAGVVSVATKTQYATGAIDLLPEAMIYGIEDAEDLQPLIKRATVCIIGPGLGDDVWAKQLFNKVISSQLPLIIDAGALRILAQAPQQNDNWVLTPHPGEAAALLSCSSNEIQEDRLKAVSLLQEKYRGNVVLKGVGSLIRTDEPATFLCDAGNSGMASAGMGDVLSGVIAGLLGQGLALADAAKIGVWLHASAADQAVQKLGERGLIASDLMPFLRLVVNE